MLNRVILMGRITHSPELKTISSGVSVVSFTVAVDRNYTPKGQEKQTDFINCVAWRQTADFIAKYFGKGSLIAVEGTLQTRKYQDKNGVNHNVTEVIVDNASFTGEKRDNTVAVSNGGYDGDQPATVGDGMVDDSILDGAPF